MGAITTASKMFVFAGVLAAMVMVAQAVAPLSPEELKQIRDFTNKAHMKRLQHYPDQIMTPSNHYVGRRIPPNLEKQPTIFMQAPSNGVVAVKPPSFQLEPQQAGAVQNYLINYPITTNTITQHQQQQQQQVQQGHPIFQQQRPQQQLQFVPVQNGGGPPRGPPPRRPPFISFGPPESAPPTSLLQFFFPKRHSRRPPQSFRPPLRFEYAQTAPNPQVLHNQNLHNIMAQQHLLTVQQQAAAAQAAQQAAAQPSAAPTNAQSTTVKNTVGAQQANSNVATASQASPPVPQQQLVNSAQINHPQHQQHFIPSHAPPQFSLNQFHRELPFFRKPIGKPAPPQKYQQVQTAYVPQNHPGDDINYIQKYAAPQHDFSFFNFGPQQPPVIAGPTNTRFGSPVSFSHIEQMPFMHQQQLPMHMVVQSQEFPHYQFTTTFTAANPGQGSVAPSVATNSGESPKVIQDIQVNSQTGSVQSSTSTRHTHRVKKVRPRVTTTTPPPTTTQSLGEIIFESAKETREFHDSSAHLLIPTISNTESQATTKPRKPKQPKAQQQQHEHAGSLQKASVESSSVVLAPLVFSEEVRESTSSPRPITSTLVSVSTISTTTPQSAPTYKPKVIKSNLSDFHKSKPINHNQHHTEKKVTASGAGLGAVTVEPMRITATSGSSNESTPNGRVVTTSVTSRVVSTGPINAQKRYRLRKVKVPNPDAVKANSNKTSTTTSSSSSSSSSTTTLPSTTPISTRTPRSTTTISSTESSLSTTTL